MADKRIRLRETISISKDTVVKKVPLKEKITESINGQELPIFGTYLIKLWAKNSFNKNGRNYKYVFDKVLRENKVTIGFVDHPEDGEESYKNVILVGKDPCMIVDENGEEWLAVYITLVGRPHGENCEAVLEAGGFIEFSSSALGEVDGSGYVLEDDFLLERYADVVVFSSNGQLFFKNHEEPREEKPDGETLYDYRNESTKNVTILNKGKESIKEKIMPDKISEKALELNIKSLIRDADSKESLIERKELLSTALSYATDLTESTISSDIKKKIDETEKSIHDLAEKGKTVDSLTENISNLSESKDSLTKEIETLKAEKTSLEENYNNIVSLYESKQYSASQKELLANQKLSTVISNLREKNSRLVENNEKVIRKLKEKATYYEALANSKVDADKVVDLSEKLKIAMDENKELAEKVVALMETVKKLRMSKLNRKVSESVRQPAFKARSVVERIKENRNTEFKNEEVETYFNALLTDDASLKEKKNDFAKCETLKEAQKLRMSMDTHTADTTSSLEKILEERGLV